MDWTKVDTVLLDMDGVLLDLRYDNWFWREHVPARFAARHGIPLEEAKARLYPKMRDLRGTMDWYCVEFWSGELGLDIVQLKWVSAHRVSLRPLVKEFLEVLRGVSDEVHLVTNAHRKTIDVKLTQTGLGVHFDEIISSHDYGTPKEDVSFWARMFGHHGFDPDRTLFIDDNLDVLRAAREFGVRHLRAISRPDSSAPAVDVPDFQALDSFEEIMP